MTPEEIASKATESLENQQQETTQQETQEEVGKVQESQETQQQETQEEQVDPEKVFRDSFTIDELRELVDMKNQFDSLKAELDQLKAGGGNRQQITQAQDDVLENLKETKKLLDGMQWQDPAQKQAYQALVSSVYKDIKSQMKDPESIVEAKIAEQIKKLEDANTEKYLEKMQQDFPFYRERETLREYERLGRRVPYESLAKQNNDKYLALATKTKQEVDKSRIEKAKERAKKGAMAGTGIGTMQGQKLPPIGSKDYVSKVQELVKAQAGLDEE